ncbi:MAG TPA: DUF4442 domain-containing protein [Actinomycetales bacterium]|nr:DUF4442 domain-containing protein [Actinomycetales bacterium]
MNTSGASGLLARIRQANYSDLDRVIGNSQLVRHFMNLWPPFLFSSIRIQEVSDDFRHVRVRLGHNRLTGNYVGTLYGGSLYSMTDPFWMMMIARALGPEYAVWDAHGEITFLKPGRQTVYAEFRITEADLDSIRAETADGQKHLRWFENEIVGKDGTVVARVRKQVYVRRKRP